MRGDEPRSNLVRRWVRVGEMAVGGDAGEGLGIPEDRGDGEAGVGDDAGAVAPDEDGVGGMGLGEDELCGCVGLAVEDGVAGGDVAEADGGDEEGRGEEGLEGSGGLGGSRGRRGW